MDVPKDVHDVGWYELGPTPGKPGDAVIDGHLDWYSGRAVFWNLAKLKADDRVEIDMADGTKQLFAVSGIGRYPYDQPPPGLFQKNGASRLSLITCAGSWDGNQYRQRLVLEAVPVS